MLTRTAQIALPLQQAGQQEMVVRVLGLPDQGQRQVTAGQAIARVATE